MKFLVVLLTLLMVYSTNWTATIKNTPIFSSYLDRMQKWVQPITHLSNRMKWVVTIGVFLLSMQLIYLTLDYLSFGLLAFLIDVMVLFYCLSDTKFSTQVGVGEILSHSLQYTFSVIFWFIVLGPVGALLYALNNAILNIPAMAEIAETASKVEDGLDWIPARLLGLCFALVGNFSAVFPYWMKNIISRPAQNYAFLAGCFDQIVLQEAVLSRESLLVDEYLKKLIHRALLLWIVTFAVFVLI